MWKVSEERWGLWCNSADSIVLFSGPQEGTPFRLVIHDLETGSRTPLASGIVTIWWSDSSGGGFLSFATTLERRASFQVADGALEFLEMETMERRVLAGPLEGEGYERIRISPDGSKVAYMIGPPDQSGPRLAEDHRLYVVDAKGGDSKLVWEFEGVKHEPGFSFSHSAEWLLVNQRRERLCNQEEQAKGYGLCVTSDLFLLDLDGGETREVSVGKPALLSLFNWNPKEDIFAYATKDTLYLESVGGSVRELPFAQPFDLACEGCESFGWSSDGRYIGLMDWWRTVGVIDTFTGEVRILVQEEGEDENIWTVEWWQ